MVKIVNIKGRQVFDSRGNPTVEADVTLSDGSVGSAIVSSGASTGFNEAHELRDKNLKYKNKSVFKAVKNINSTIFKSLRNQNPYNQKKIDNILIDLDGSKNKSKLGANAILAVSIANCKASAVSQKKEIYEYLSVSKKYSLPYPMMNIINGGVHANNSLQIQEFMIRPDKAKNFSEAIRMCFLVIHELKKEIGKKFHTTVGDEGGFAPNLKKDEHAIILINKAIKKVGFDPSIDFSICLDIAANELKTKKTINYYDNLISRYNVKSIEDPFPDKDWNLWSKMTKKIGKKIQIIGDDLFCTNEVLLKKGIKQKSANAILIKLNQIGTVSETLKTIKLAKKNNFTTIVSHRSGDSEDTFIADLAVATESNQIKTGSLARSERVAKYNRLLRIEERLGKSSKMAKV